MTPFLLVGNLKMNPVTRAEVEQYLAVLRREAAATEWKYAEAVLCPAFVHIPLFTDLPKGFFVGAQHGFPEKNGAFTGEVSFAMLKDLGVNHIIIGHSERRAYFGETIETIRERVLGALKYSITPIVCVGETKSEKEAGKAETIIEADIKAIFSDISKMQAEKIVLAYEPRWAIGSGETPTTEEIAAKARFMREVLGSMVGEEASQRVSILYGGSVKAATLAEVSFLAGMQGALVGGESLFAYEMVKMMHLAEEYCRVNSEEETK
jgi:triosephosphate isomerase (TIM)